MATALAAPVDFDIPRQRADVALTTFARQAGLPILFPYDLVSSRTANALRGRLEPAVALRQLLAGTGLEASTDESGQISVRLMPRAQPPVSGLVRSLRAIEKFVAVQDPEAPLTEVTVTGSRIERDGMVTPTPVTALYGAELQTMSPGPLVDALVQLPQFINNDTPQTQAFATGGAAGASFMNLRGIGSSRTLTLLDGRRLVPATRSGSIDIALLPKSIIQRIEVVTGGASAAYGSDAVSGVVNVLLEPRGDGVKLRGQGGISERGDAANNEWSVSYGTPVGEHSHLLLAGEIARSDGIRGYASRPWFDSWAVVSNPDPAGPAEITVRDAHATGYTYGGLITRGPLAGTQFLAGGVPAPFVTGAHATGTTQSGGSGVDPARDLVWILPDQIHGSAYGKFETAFGNGASAFVQTLFGYSDNHYDKDPPSFWGPWEATIFADNAFLPPATRAAMQAAGVSSMPLGRVAPELGPAAVHNRSRLLSTTLGFDTPVATRGWELEGYYQYGTTHAELAYAHIVRVDRMYRALDSVVDPATGRAICRSTLTFPDDGCVPANPFGPGSISAEAAAYITEGRTEQDQQVAQHVAELKAQGPLFDAPAGTSTLAVGGAWRQESVDNHPLRFPSSLEGLIVRPGELEGYRGLPPSYAGNPNIFERTAFSYVNGSYSVWELFAENDLPLLRGGPGLRGVDFNSAARYAWYSGSGGVLAWKGGIDWRLSRELRLRATRSRDVRAGSLSERFDSSGMGSTVNDPFRPGNPPTPIVGVRSGNPAIDPEQADTLTFGGVYQPAFVPGLSLSVDYYDIRVGDAIASLGVQAIVDRCFAGDTLFCPQIVRDPTTNLIVAVNNGFQNIAQARSRGIDAELSLRRRISLFGGAEGIALRMFANRALESSTTNIGEAPVDRVGQTGLPGGAPRWQANLTFAYERGPLQLTLQERVISRGTYNAIAGPALIDDNRIGGAAYTNLRASWRFGEDPQSLLVFFNVNNLFDRDPPLAADWGFVGSIATNEGLFDVIGRRYTLGLRWRR